MKPIGGSAGDRFRWQIHPMKQLLEDLRTGSVELAEVPRPLVRPGHLLIATEKSLVSTGTERMLVEFGKFDEFVEVTRATFKVAGQLRGTRTAEHERVAKPTESD